jgi:excisionase family DNA binding protein
MTDTAFALPADRALLSVEQVAEFLNVSRLTVYRLIERRLLATFRVARRLRLSRGAVGRYLANVKTPDAYGGTQD